MSKTTKLPARIRYGYYGKKAGQETAKYGTAVFGPRRTLSRKAASRQFRATFTESRLWGELK